MSMTATLVKSGHTKLPEPGLHLEEVARPGIERKLATPRRVPKGRRLSCSKEDHLDGNKEYPLVVALGCYRCGQMVKAVPRSCSLGHVNRETGIFAGVVSTGIGSKVRSNTVVFVMDATIEWITSIKGRNLPQQNYRSPPEDGPNALSGNSGSDEIAGLRKARGFEAGKVSIRIGTTPFTARAPTGAPLSLHLDFFPCSLRRLATSMSIPLAKWYMLASTPMP